ncbi:MAG: ComEC/Rec2 family competence protein, partial [Gemmatimonadota bacterium]
MGALPPVARLATAFAAGVAVAALPGRLVPALLLLVPLLPLIRASSRRVHRLRLVVASAVLAGFVSSVAATAAARCNAAPVRSGARLAVDGAFLSEPVEGRTAPFRVLGGRCAFDLRATASGPVRPGERVHLEGRWREGRAGGILLTDRMGPPRTGPARSASMVLVRWRGRLNRRIRSLYGDRAPVVSALTLASRQGLDPGLREAFARSGLAHLLAISGFHVGVVTVLVGVLLRRLGLRRRGAGLVAALVAWAYVAFLGFPDAACRAALILAALAVSRARGRPPARWGALGAALLLLLTLDPRRLGSPGFQLSFAGAGGLTAWAPGLRARLRAGPLRSAPPVASAVAAGVAATVGTLPVVAWHFERVSLVGIPATLVAAPLVALALPGALASLVVDVVHPAAGRFLAGGVDVVLALTEHAVRLAAAPTWASVWVPRSWVVVGGVGAVAAGLVVRRTRGRVRGTPRRIVMALGGAAAVAAWPLLLTLQARGTVEIVALDVGQGDAIAVRSPAGRWLLVDAGPPWEGEARGSPVVRALRRRGVRRLELLVLTHPDLDHVGGAAGVLSA